MHQVETSGDGSLTGLWSRLWRRPDGVLADAGRQSELVVARVRVAVTSLLLLVPVANLVVQPHLAEHRIGFGVTLAALLSTIAITRTETQERHASQAGR